jgi:hypothetical protein
MKPDDAVPVVPVVPHAVNKPTPDECKTLWIELANMSHYHVIATRTGDDNLTYTDGFLHENALGYAAEMIAPQAGGRDPRLEAVWVAEGLGRCPLIHGDDDAPEEGADEFLTQAMAAEPYWMADATPAVP